MAIKRGWKILVWIIGTLLLLVVLLAASVPFLSDRKKHREIDIRVAPVAYVSDPAALARGKYLFQSRGCAECHGENGAGRLFIDAPNGFRVWSPNISPGAGSVVASYKEADWVRAIRHGVRPDKRPLLIMPSEDYNRMTDVDLAALVAYVRSLPPAAGQPARFEMPLLLKALYVAGVVRDAPERIDHSLPPAQPVAEGVTPEHGAYVAQMCKGCHGDALKGGKIPGAPPDWPPAADLTAAATYATYDSPQKFRTMMRSGKRPNGSAIQVMPFATLAQMNDTDLDALYLYLSALPRGATAQR
jgi:mono/diheme cytochrome c family protein